MSKGMFSDQHGLSRRDLLLVAGTAAATLATYSQAARAAPGGGTLVIDEVKQGEDVFAYISRIKGGFDETTYRQVLGCANAFKEGDQTIGVVAENDTSRTNARPFWQARRSETFTSARCLRTICKG